MLRCLLMFTCSMVGAGFCLLLLFASTSSVSALVGSLEPVDFIIEVGTDLALNCTLDDAPSNGDRTAHNIIWYHYPRQLPRDSYTTFGDTVSQLSLANVTLGDTGDYICAFPGDGYMQRLGSEVTVASKPKPAILKCFIPSPDEYWCRWEEGTPTVIDTEHTFTFWYNGRWTDCPTRSTSRVDINTCSIPLRFNIDVTQRVRVTSRNALGEAYVEKTFNRQADVVVNPPRNVELTKLQTETSLRIAWDLPDRWDRSGSSLHYKLRFMRDDCMMTDSSCCCWTEVLDVGVSSAYTLRDRDPYTVYNVQLAARYTRAREENWSDWSAEVAARTRETAPTEAVQGLEYREENSLADPVYMRDVYMWWMVPPEESFNGRALGYKIILDPEDTEESVRESFSHQAWSAISGLQKFSGYRIKVAAYNSADQGPWSVVHVADRTTAPNAPDEVRAVALTTTSILVEWKGPSEPNGYILHYIVEWGRSNSNRESHTTTNATQLSYVIEGLDTFTLYEVSVKARNSRGDSEFKSIMGGARTLEGVPEAAPTNVEVKPTENQPDILTLIWEQLPVESVNGILIGYLISFCESSREQTTGKKCSGKVQQQNVTRPDAVTEKLSNLKPATEYTVWVAAYTVMGMGPESEPVHGKTAEESEGLLLEAILIPVVLLGIVLIGICAWLFRPYYCSKFTQDKNLSKNVPHGSSIKIDQEHCDEIVPSPHVATISGLCKNDICELAKEAWQTSSTLDLIFKSDPETKIEKFIIHSDSGDSGVPPSPANDNPDFNALRDKPSITEGGDDSVFLEDEDGGLPSSDPEKLTVRIDSMEKYRVMSKNQQLPEGPASQSSPTGDVGPCSLVGQFTPTNKCSPNA